MGKIEAACRGLPSLTGSVVVCHLLNTRSQLTAGKTSPFYTAIFAVNVSYNKQKLLDLSI